MRTHAVLKFIVALTLLLMLLFNNFFCLFQEPGMFNSCYSRGIGDSTSRWIYWIEVILTAITIVFVFVKGLRHWGTMLVYLILLLIHVNTDFCDSVIIYDRLTSVQVVYITHVIMFLVASTYWIFGLTKSNKN